MSNFSFLEDTEWAGFLETTREAEKHVYQAPMYSAMLCRKSLEEWVRWIYEHDADLELPYDSKLSSLIHHYDFKDLIGGQLGQLNLIRKTGNNAVHSKFKVKPDEALFALKKLHGFIQWVVLMYSPDKPKLPVFDSTIIHKESGADRSKQQLQQIEEQFLESQSEIERLKAELEKFKKIKEENEAIVPPPVDPDEAETRIRYIDVMLREAGWDPNGSNVAEYEVEGMPKGDGTIGTGYVDYVLWGDDGKPLAVVEAKRTRRDAKVGQNQARLYADCLEKKFNQRPVIFFSNGYETMLWDDLEYPPREVMGFYTKDELQMMVNRRSSKKPLKDFPINKGITDRYYQEEAIRSITEEFERAQRKTLLVMATGTGKTRTAASLVEVMSKANWVKRVLFLADRVALVKQAKRAFNDHLPELTSINLTKEKETESSRITFSTYQTLINQIDGEKQDDGRYFGVGHFDLIIFDEIHRSVYNKYKAIFDYFDGLKVGLTATPKDEADRDTYALFDLEQSNPTYAYELDQAVEDGNLVPYRSISVPTKFQREGIKYSDLSEEERMEYEAEFADPLTGEYPDEIQKTALNNWLFNEDTVDKILAYIMENGHKVEGGDKLGKTIVFARNQDHAEFIKKRFDIQFPQFKGDFCQVISYKVEYAHDLIDKFSVKESNPFIALSVDMLDTGIDVPEVLNLVIFKPVRSKAKFWQMIGRGTRLCEDLYAIGEDKFDFLVFDLCENFEFFEVNENGVEATKTKSLSQKLFESRLRLSEILKDKKDDPDLIKISQDMREFLIKQTGALDTNSFLIRKHLKYVEKYQDRHNWQHLSDLELKELMDHIGPLMVETESDEMAKRFDSLLFDIMIALELKGEIMSNGKDKVISVAQRLSKKLSVTQVKAKKDLLDKVQAEQFWESASLTELEHVRSGLRELIRFLDPTERPLAYTNFQDEIGQVSEPKSVYQTVNLEQYRRRVEQYIREHKNHLVIDKLFRNEPITETEIKSLENHLFAQGELGDREQFEKAYGDEPLVKFVKRIVGMDVNAAKKAFSEFLATGSLNSKQIRFIDLIISYLTVNGSIEPSMLFEPPFTDIDSGSIISLFDQEESEKLKKILDAINEAG